MQDPILVSRQAVQFPNKQLFVSKRQLTFCLFKHLTPELNPSAQRCLPRIFTGDFVF
jgi:hypothetical protein